MKTLKEKDKDLGALPQTPQGACPLTHFWGVAPNPMPTAGKPPQQVGGAFLSIWGLFHVSRVATLSPLDTPLAYP